MTRYKQDRQSSAKLEAKADWFPNAAELEAATADTTNFEAVKGFRGVIDGRQLALGSESPKAQPGDVVRIVYRNKSGQSRRLLMVYMGEESFPGSDRTRSFFIYPINGKLEYNTFPPRKDERYLKRVLTKASGKLLASLKLSLVYNFDHDPGHDTDWLKGRTIGKTSLYVKLPLQDARYQVYRARAYPPGREGLPPFADLWAKYRAIRPEIKSTANATVPLTIVAAMPSAFCTRRRAPPGRSDSTTGIPGRRTR